MVSCSPLGSCAPRLCPHSIWASSPTGDNITVPGPHNSQALSWCSNEQLSPKLGLHAIKKSDHSSTKKGVSFPLLCVPTKGQGWILFQQDWGFFRQPPWLSAGRGWWETCASPSLAELSLVRVPFPPLKPIAKTVVEFMPNAGTWRVVPAERPAFTASAFGELQYDFRDYRVCYFTHIMHLNYLIISFHIITQSHLYVNM